MTVTRALGIAFALVALASGVCRPVAAEPALLERFHDLRATDDLDQMVKRRFVRALVVYNKTLYFLDRGRERGVAAEGLHAFEKHLNQEVNRKRKAKLPKVHVLAVPVARDQLIPWLLEGRGDIAAANLTITPERLKQVDFADPFHENASEVLVTGADVAAPQNQDDLSGQEVCVRRSSSYYESLMRLNGVLELQGRPPVVVQVMDERLEDEDLLEMVNAGLIPRVVVDDYKARLWAEVLGNIRLTDVVLNRGGRIAWAVRKNNPRLKALIDSFVAGHKSGTLLYNIAFKRYFGTTKWVRNATSSIELAKFEATVVLFREYGERYGFDPLLLSAQAYQESGLDQSKRSQAGAVGVMQVLPSTGAAMKVGDINKLGPNIHAGVKYLRKLVDRYFNDPGIDVLNRTLFAFAAYNAGPTRISRLRSEAGKAGLDPNLWFNNVERIAAKRIGQETVQYVANIYKYYVAYSLSQQRKEEREKARRNAAS